jgi:hypothetical protein
MKGVLLFLATQLISTTKDVSQREHIDFFKRALKVRL